MNSELTQTGNVGSTDNPQGAGTSPGASNSADFQKAAGPEVLNQTRSLTVADNGQAISPSPSAHQVSGSMNIVIIIGIVAILMLFVRLFMRLKSSVPPAAAVVGPVVTVTPPKPKPAAKKKGNKKQPRSKRKKT